MFWEPCFLVWVGAVASAAGAVIFPSRFPVVRLRISLHRSVFLCSSRGACDSVESPNTQPAWQSKLTSMFKKHLSTVREQHHFLWPYLSSCPPWFPLACACPTPKLWVNSLRCGSSIDAWNRKIRQRSSWATSRQRRVCAAFEF